MPSDYVRKECQQFLFLFHTTSDYSVVDIFYFFGGKLPIVCYCFVVMYYYLPGSLHILVTSFLVFWLSRTTKIISLGFQDFFRCYSVAIHIIYTRNDIGQKCEGNFVCGFLMKSLKNISWKFEKNRGCRLSC